jgi:hypothetical protein
MEKGTTHVALDDSKRKIVAGILRPDATQPELRELPHDPHHIQRLFARLKREGPVVACYEAGVSGYDLYRQITALAVPCQARRGVCARGETWTRRPPDDAAHDPLRPRPARPCSVAAVVHHPRGRRSG